MKKHLVIIGIVAILVTVGLSGCDSNNTYPTNTANIERNKFIGTWIRTSYDFGTQGINLTVIFFSDGTLNANNWIDFNYASNWEIKDRMLTVSLAGSVIHAWDYVFSNIDRTLTLTDTNGKTIVYTKQ